MRQPVTWCIADTHFNHEAIVEHCGRPADFKEQIMTNMRRLIAPQDTLIHLGDVIFYQYPELKAMLDSVPCRKFLALGNHDHKTWRWYCRNGFDFAAESFVLDGVHYTHKPSPLAHDATVQIHGHLHLGAHRTALIDAQSDWYGAATHHLLSLERENYMPVNVQKWLIRQSTSVQHTKTGGAA